MGKKYTSKRLQNQYLLLGDHKNVKSTDNTAQTSAEQLATTIEKKLKLSRAQLRARSTSTTQRIIEDEDEPPVVDDEPASHDIPFDNVNIVVSIGMILNLVNKLRCPLCNRAGKMSQKVTQRRGLLYHITFSCTCSFETSFTNSTQLVDSASARMDELNMMTCVAANVAGIKRTGMTTILGILNILPPVQIERWKKYQKIYSSALDVVKDESLGRAGKIHYFFYLFVKCYFRIIIFVAEEAADQSPEPADHEGVTNIKVSIDGTWLTRRGHSSLHGVATVCSTSDPPKVLDFECLSRHCTICSGLLGIRERNPEMYQQLLAEHIESGCEENHSGSSSGMEAAGFTK
jgi:transcription elongation factor Elf1